MRTINSFIIFNKIEEKNELPEKELPEKDGWYWIESNGEKIPSWFMSNLECFLPGGMGDSSSTGMYLEDINKIGPPIIEPKF